ncbi:MAG: hypothetical protein ACI8W8_001688 [Rhodothermales bacterium]|jgi:hypothetical protein
MEIRVGLEFLLQYRKRGPRDSGFPQDNDFGTNHFANPAFLPAVRLRKIPWAKIDYKQDSRTLSSAARRQHLMAEILPTGAVRFAHPDSGSRRSRNQGNTGTRSDPGQPLQAHIPRTHARLTPPPGLPRSAPEWRAFDTAEGVVYRAETRPAWTGLRHRRSARGIVATSHPKSNGACVCTLRFSRSDWTALR